MSLLNIVVDNIRKIYSLQDKCAYCTQLHDEHFNINNIAEFACSVSVNLDIDNWFLFAGDNYFALEVNECFMIVYFAVDRVDKCTEFVIRRCNSDYEFKLVLDAI